MRKPRMETEEQRAERSVTDARIRHQRAVAEDKAIDEMIKRSIKIHGP